MKNILIAGGTGLLGRHLSKLLRERGHKVFHLSRQPNPNAMFPAYKWDLEKRYADEKALEKADCIINLAGAGIADGRWTAARKKIIVGSRVASTQLLQSFIEKKKTPATACLSASAIGYYGNRGERWVSETDPPGDTRSAFLPAVVTAWEDAIDNVAHTGIRTVVFRIGIVLSTKGGALPKMLFPFRFFTGAWFGTGNMYYSWIHIDDLARMFIHAIENENLRGCYNAVAPNPATNKEIVLACKKALRRPALLFPVPVPVLRLAMGEMADMVLHSTRASSGKIEKTGFHFHFPELLPAINDLLERKC